MFDTEIIKYPSRAKAVEAIHRLQGNTDIKRIDIGNYGRTLTLTIDNQPHDVDGEPDIEAVLHDEHSNAFADYDDYDDTEAFDEAADDGPLETIDIPADDIEDLLGGSPAAVEPVEAPAATEPEPGTPDALGVDTDDVEAGVEAPEVPDVSEATRADLRTVVTEWGLDVEIPGSGALAPVREKVAGALAALDND